jgi:hypothetical protein
MAGLNDDGRGTGRNTDRSRARAEHRESGPNTVKGSARPDAPKSTASAVIRTAPAPTAVRPTTGWVPGNALEVAQHATLAAELGQRPQDCLLRDSRIDLGKSIAILPDAVLREATRISDADEIELARKLEPHFKSKFRKEGMALDAPETRALEAYLNRLLKHLLKTSTHRALPYRVRVLHGEMENAFATPGGSLYFTDRMLNTLADESEVMAVLAHEIGHVERRHTVFAYQLALQAEGDDLALLAARLLTIPMNSEYEREADQWSTHAVTRAQYDPLGAVRFWARAARKQAPTGTKPASGSADETLIAIVESVIELTDSHPPASDRCARALEAAGQALAESKHAVYYRGATNLARRQPGFDLPH